MDLAARIAAVGCLILLLLQASYLRGHNETLARLAAKVDGDRPAMRALVGILSK